MFGTDIRPLRNSSLLGRFLALTNEFRSVTLNTGIKYFISNSKPPLLLLIVINFKHAITYASAFFAKTTIFITAPLLTQVNLSI